LPDIKANYTLDCKGLACPMPIVKTKKAMDQLEAGQAEYAFNRIPGAMSIPLGELEQRINELNPEEAIIIICRSGTRSDLACQLLTEKGFKNVKNAEQGMVQWIGPTEKNE